MKRIFSRNELGKKDGAPLMPRDNAELPIGRELCSNTIYRINACPTRRILIIGPSGVGKTVLANRIMDMYRFRLNAIIDCAYNDGGGYYLSKDEPNLDYEKMINDIIFEKYRKRFILRPEKIQPWPSPTYFNIVAAMRSLNPRSFGFEEKQLPIKDLETVYQKNMRGDTVIDWTGFTDLYHWECESVEAEYKKDSDTLLSAILKNILSWRRYSGDTRRNLIVLDNPKFGPESIDQIQQIYEYYETGQCDVLITYQGELKSLVPEVYEWADLFLVSVSSINNHVHELSKALAASSCARKNLDKLTKWYRELRRYGYLNLPKFSFLVIDKDDPERERNLMISYPPLSSIKRKQQNVN